MLPFFIRTDTGVRFCLVHEPPKRAAVRGGIIYVHPFAEEMNKARRMAALQARAFAERGFTVVQVDLFACGDSSGELRDATVEHWLKDIETAAAWLAERSITCIWLWGLRLGALLATYASTRLPNCRNLILWSPVVSGETHLAQFLRVGVAADMMGQKRTPGTGLRERLRRGETVEVAGYEISPELAAGLNGLNLAGAPVPKQEVHWFEITEAEDLPPASAKVISGWETAGVSVHRHTVPGEKFWSTVEITECGSLIEQTAELAALHA